jgi:hypothetical protein
MGGSFKVGQMGRQAHQMIRMIRLKSNQRGIQVIRNHIGRDLLTLLRQSIERIRILSPFRGAHFAYFL